MNLTKLFEMQKVLDERIVKKKGLEGQDLLPMKILALQVELGELANEWRGFKFWSENIEPRTDEFILKKEYQHLRITQTDAYEFQLRDEYGNIKFDVVTDDHHDRRNLVLEEYVDCLHFILSIGLEGISQCDINQEYTPLINTKDDVVSQFSSLYNSIASYVEGDFLEITIELFLGLGELLDFTWEQIEQAYYDKNAINHTRQDSGY